MDPMTGLNRGFCFVTYSEKEGAQEAVKQVRKCSKVAKAKCTKSRKCLGTFTRSEFKNIIYEFSFQLDNFEIRKGKNLKCNISVANLRLFVGNIPKSKSKEEILEEFSKITGKETFEICKIGLFVLVSEFDLSQCDKFHEHLPSFLCRGSHRCYHLQFARWCEEEEPRVCIPRIWITQGSIISQTTVVVGKNTSVGLRHHRRLGRSHWRTRLGHNVEGIFPWCCLLLTFTFVRKGEGFASFNGAVSKDQQPSTSPSDGQTEAVVTWLFPLQVKVLYVRNLKSDVTEEQLKEKFEPYGKIERVKKIKDYGFIHFEDRDDAVKAMDELNGTVNEEYTHFFVNVISCVAWLTGNAKIWRNIR